MSKTKPSWSDPETIQDVVSIVVGSKNPKTITAYTKFLTYWSPYFARVFDGAFQEATTRTLKLDLVEPEVFGLFIAWVYSGKFGTSHHANPVERQVSVPVTQGPGFTNDPVNHNQSPSLLASAPALTVPTVSTTTISGAPASTGPRTNLFANIPAPTGATSNLFPNAPGPTGPRSTFFANAPAGPKTNIFASAYPNAPTPTVSAGNPFASAPTGPKTNLFANVFSNAPAPTGSTSTLSTKASGHTANNLFANTPTPKGPTSNLFANAPAPTGSTSNLFASITPTPNLSANNTPVPTGSTPSLFAGAPTSRHYVPSNTGPLRQCTGTSVPFQRFVEKEPNSSTNQMNEFQNIGFQKEYMRFSQEEVRVADYAQGRKYNFPRRSFKYLHQPSGQDLVNLWILADYLQVPKLQNYTMDQLWNKMKQVGGQIDIYNLVYEKTAVGSGLRKMVVGWVGSIGIEGKYMRQNPEYFPKDFLYDLAVFSVEMAKLKSAFNGRNNTRPMAEYYVKE